MQQPLETQSMYNPPNITDAPTHTDVLLGRGVSTNRHPGNENFRLIVGRHVDVYVTSTKKQKMNISKSVVEQLHKLSPPGRFLEKNTGTGLWQEVDQKRALEKTAQALRDGAAPLRKKMAEDLSIIMSSGDHQGPPPKKQRADNPVLEVLQSTQRNQQAQLQSAIDEDEFTREMGPDEHFFDLCNSAPINVFGSGDTNIFD